MKKLTKMELLASFLEKYKHVVFCKEHLEVIGDFLIKRVYLKRNPIAQNIDFVSQEKTTIKYTSSIEISRHSATGVTVKIISMAEINIFEIETRVSVDEIIELLKKSNCLNEFAVRKTSESSASLQTEKKPLAQQSWIPILGNVSMEQKKSGYRRHGD